MLSEREETIELIHNLYKDRYGIRPRHVDFASMTLEEMDAMVEDLDAIPLEDDGIDWDEVERRMDEEDATLLNERAAEEEERRNGGSQWDWLEVDARW